MEGQQVRRSHDGHGHASAMRRLAAEHARGGSELESQPSMGLSDLAAYGDALLSMPSGDFRNALGPGAEGDADAGLQVHAQKRIGAGSRPSAHVAGIDSARGPPRSRFSSGEPAERPQVGGEGEEEKGVPGAARARRANANARVHEQEQGMEGVQEELEEEEEEELSEEEEPEFVKIPRYPRGMSLEKGVTRRAEQGYTQGEGRALEGDAGGGEGRSPPREGGGTESEYTGYEESAHGRRRYAHGAHSSTEGGSGNPSSRARSRGVPEGEGAFAPSPSASRTPQDRRGRARVVHTDPEQTECEQMANGRGGRGSTGRLMGLRGPGGADHTEDQRGYTDGGEDLLGLGLAGGAGGATPKGRNSAGYKSIRRNKTRGRVSGQVKKDIEGRVPKSGFTLGAPDLSKLDLDDDEDFLTSVPPAASDVLTGSASGAPRGGGGRSGTREKWQNATVRLRGARADKFLSPSSWEHSDWGGGGGGDLTGLGAGGASAVRPGRLAGGRGHVRRASLGQLPEGGQAADWASAGMAARMRTDAAPPDADAMSDAGAPAAARPLAPEFGPHKSLPKTAAAERRRHLETRQGGASLPPAREPSPGRTRGAPGAEGGSATGEEGRDGVEEGGGREGEVEEDGGEELDGEEGEGGEYEEGEEGEEGEEEGEEEEREEDDADGHPGGVIVRRVKTAAKLERLQDSELDSGGGQEEDMPAKLVSRSKTSLERDEGEEEGEGEGEGDGKAWLSRNMSFQNPGGAIKGAQKNMKRLASFLGKSTGGAAAAAGAVVARHATAPRGEGKKPPKPLGMRGPTLKRQGSGGDDKEWADLPAPKRVQFQLSELQLATDNFHHSNVLGQGGFGMVYLGLLPVKPAQEVAVKVLKKSGAHAQEEFKTELELLSRLDHKHLVKLLGFCLTAKDRLLVYEYISNGSLFDHLHGKKREQNGPLSWDRRLRIAVGAARGLRYLHSQRPQILHRDIKAANILLTDKLSAKVADFGCAKLIRQTVSMENEETGEVVERLMESVDVAMGTHGLMAPEMLEVGEISAAGDIYSFGVVLLELVSGMQPIMHDGRQLVQWAQPLLEGNKWDELVDPCILDQKGGVSGVVGHGFKAHVTPSSSLARTALLAKACIAYDPLARPSIEEVAHDLQLIYYERDMPAPVPPSKAAADRAELQHQSPLKGQGRTAVRGEAQG